MIHQTYYQVVQMNYPLLDKIATPDDLNSFSLDELIDLSKEIRDRILKVLSVNGGHLSSNLGIVELTIALHKVFDSPNDKFIFDTSHQAYTHKLLTGRNKLFDTLRQYKGLCGFSHPEESPHDHFFSGHAGATFSTALGLAKSRDLNNETYQVLPVMGDASFTCGLTLEALNNIPKDLKRFVVILNDNNMAISKNVGNFRNILSRLINNPTSNKLYLEIQEKLSKIPNIGNFLAIQGQKIKESIKNLVSSASFFEHFGLTYIGPIDGHDIKKMVDTFTSIKNMQKPVIVHVITTKGKGLNAAKENPTSYHGVKPFNLQSGKFLNSKDTVTFPKIFGKHLLDLSEKDQSIITISPAMLSGSSLTALKNKLPDRCIDVGIAEGHCVTYAGGLAYKNKNKVVVSIYSTFLQRALDNVFHDVCLQKLPVIFAIDRAGLSGPDGATHHGIYDIGFLIAMPNLVITQPRDGTLLKELLTSSLSYNKPFAMRYPNLPTETNSLNDLNATSENDLNPRPLGKAEILKKGKDILIISLGHHYKTAFEISDILKTHNIDVTIVDPIFLKPLDEDLFKKSFATHKLIVTIEEHAVSCGLGSIINTFAAKHSFINNQIMNFGISDTFVQHGKNEDLLKELGLNANSISKEILNRIELTKKKCEVSQ